MSIKTTLATILLVAALLAPSLASARDEDNHMISITNVCSRDINVAIRFQNLEGEWVNYGWYYISTYRSAALALTKADHFFIYANSYDYNDLQSVWDGEDYRGTVWGEEYSFKKINIDSDGWTDFSYTLQCGDKPRYNYISLAWSADGNWGFSVKRDLESSKARALELCGGDDNNCSLVDTGAPEQGMHCIAISQGDEGKEVYGGWANNKADSVQKSLEGCSAAKSKCTIKGSACNNIYKN